MNEPPDELAGVLGPVPATPPDPARRVNTLSATVRTLHRGRQLRRALVVAGVVVSFIGGGVSGWLAKPTPLTVVVIASHEPDATPPNKPLPVEIELTPEQLELRAELADDPSAAARLFREAGDRFLTDRRDYENAARCYRRHLAVADDHARKESASDSWMLHTMKSPAR